MFPNNNFIVIFECLNWLGCDLWHIWLLKILVGRVIVGMKLCSTIVLKKLLTWMSRSTLRPSIYHTTMLRNAINFLYDTGHVNLWCVEVVLVVYCRPECYFSYPEMRTTSIIACNLQTTENDFDVFSIILWYLPAMTNTGTLAIKQVNKRFYDHECPSLRLWRGVWLIRRTMIKQI